MPVSTNITNTLKRIYPGPNGFTVAALRNHPLSSMIKKTTGFTGVSAHRAIQYTLPAGVSLTFANAQSAASLAKTVQWTLTRKNRYGSLTLTGDDIHASKSNEGAFVSALKQQADACLSYMGQQIGHAMYRDKYASIGARASAATNVITLSNASDALYFMEGMTVCASSAAYSMRTGTTTVTAVDYDAGTVTLTSAAAITSFADTDLLYPAHAAGDIGTSFNGLAGWIPLTAPTAGDSFNGVDRSVNPVLLSGHRLNDTTGTYEEILQELMAKVSRTADKGTPQELKIMMNPVPYGVFLRQLGSKVEYYEHKTAEVGFGGILIHGAIGTVNVQPDPDCASNRTYLLNLKDWDMLTMGPDFPHVIEDDGMPFVRSATADAVEGRLRCWGDLYCCQPKNQGVAALP